VMARAALGAALGARVPAVGEQGVVRLDGATHPLLASAAATGAAAPAGGVTAVVGNRLELGGEGCPQGLVLTGPNGGGKSVALKTVGLAALLVRCAVPVPCSPARDGEGEGGGGAEGGAGVGGGGRGGRGGDGTAMAVASPRVGLLCDNDETALDWLRTYPGVAARRLLFCRGERLGGGAGRGGGHIVVLGARALLRACS